MSTIKSAKFPKLKQHVEVKSASDLSGVKWPEGVVYFPLQKHMDERGYFMEVMRFAQLEKINFHPKQVSLSQTKAGIVKAFHYHEKQSDLFCPVNGSFRIALLDVRPGSATFGFGYSVYFDSVQPFVLHIPPGVAHGYQILGNDPATMLYVMNREYDPQDELRADWNDPGVSFPW